jgi:1-acyl-sn-glycerol-3-phosphate acyltransferase
MTALRIFYRSTFLCVVMVTGCLITIFFQKGAMPRQGLSSKITCWWHRRLANAFGIPVRVFGTPSDKATLFVANHISWFDISAIGSILPVRFLAKIEVKHMPVMGWLASRAGTLYIPRGGKTAADTANETMANALQQDHHVVLFAEGTTGDGNIKRFHSRLIQSAITAGSTLQPIAIRYPSNNQNNVHPAALFVGDTTMGQSVTKIMSTSDLVVEIHFLEPVEVTNKNRDELAAYAEDKVRSVIENGQDVS